MTTQNERDTERRGEPVILRGARLEAVLASLATDSHAGAFDETHHRKAQEILDFLSIQKRPVLFSQYLDRAHYLGIFDPKSVEIFDRLGYDVRSDMTIVFPDEPELEQWAS